MLSMLILGPVVCLVFAIMVTKATRRWFLYRHHFRLSGLLAYAYIVFASMILAAYTLAMVRLLDLAIMGMNSASSLTITQSVYVEFILLVCYVVPTYRLVIKQAKTYHPTSMVDRARARLNPQSDK